MKLKRDENIGNRGAGLIREAGHDVATVVEQALTSSTDNQIFSVCCAEERCLVSLDLDFSNPMVFDPVKSAGIAVLRLPASPSHTDLIDTIRCLLRGLEKDDISGQLWIIQKERIRIYSGPE